MWKRRGATWKMRCRKGQMPEWIKVAELHKLASTYPLAPAKLGTEEQSSSNHLVMVRSLKPHCAVQQRS